MLFLIFIKAVAFKTHPEGNCTFVLSYFFHFLFVHLPVSPQRLSLIGHTAKPVPSTEQILKQYFC